MSQLLTVLVSVLAYSDGVTTNNPQLQDFSYQRQLPDQPTSKTRSQQYVVSPAEVEIVLNLARLQTIGASWSIATVDGSLIVRATWSGVNPVLRTERVGSTLLNTDTYGLARLGFSKIVRVNFGVKTIGAGVVPGDEIYFGPNSGLSVSDQGVYSVVAATANTVDIIAPDMSDQPVVPIVTASDIYVFSSGPVRVNDFAKFGSAFSFGNRGEFQITRVTSRFIEFQNANCVPEGPITQDVTCYDQVYKVMFLETDQTVNVYINGSSVPLVVEPYAPGQAGLVGFLLIRSPVFSVSIENLGSSEAHVTTFFAT